MVNLTCFDELKKIISNESLYKIQLISLEPAQTILQLFRLAEIEFETHYLSLKNDLNQNRSTVSLLINDLNKNVSNLLEDRYKNESFILISKVPVPFLLYVPLQINENDTLLYLRSYVDQRNEYFDSHNIEKNILVLEQSKNTPTEADLKLHLKKYFKNYPLYLLVKMLFIEQEQPIPLNTKECFVMMAVSDNKNFDQIVKAVKKSMLPENTSDIELNDFEILMVLNKLIRYKFLKRKGKSYVLNVTRTYLNLICHKIGFDIQKKREI
ncbi:hypothetical protein M153_571000278 [Pseudoloma neurophilia]|uniref:Uncharacterized protein n=1 Tax=Pseudoloma neurophilia TaxID=146866 RepID=A0A0R0M2G1_9MICR|nr:hypothetical protein M153_571000278 [Pseudoloma neurophilia]